MTRARDPLVLLWVAVGAFAAGFAALSSLRHEALATGRFDLGNMVQAVWSTANGRPLEATSLTGEQFVRLGAHFDPVLALLAPLWWAWPSPHALLAVQALATALGAVPLFLLARKHTGSERAALGLALAYLLSPALHWQTLSEFHPVALATPLVLLAIWALDDDRPVVLAVAAVLALMTKEHVGLVLAVVGATFLLVRRSRAAAALAAAGIVVAAIAVMVVIPAFRPESAPPVGARYASIDGPADAVAAVTERRDAAYVLRLLIPLAGLPLVAPATAAAALPEVGVNLLSATRTQTSIHYHYSAVALPALFAAAAFAVRRLARRGYRAEHVALGVLSVTLAATVAMGPLPIWRHVPGGEDLGARAFRVSEHDQIAHRALALVPDDAVVSTTNSLGAHLSARERVLSFPRLRGAEWVVVDETAPAYLDRVAAPLAHAAAVARLRRSAEWRVVFSEDAVVVFQRER